MQVDLVLVGRKIASTVLVGTVISIAGEAACPPSWALPRGTTGRSSVTGGTLNLIVSSFCYRNILVILESALKGRTNQ